MTFLYEDLPHHGLILLPPSSDDYDPLLAGIESRADHPVDGAPPYPDQFRPRIVPGDRSTSAILLNRGPNTVAALHVVWHFVTETGRTFRNSRGMLSPKSLLLPFQRPSQSHRDLFGYWHTIFPGSARYLGESGMVGDNSDVRPPGETEKWRGGMVMGGGGGSNTPREPIRQVTLVLDGVFFLDGGFVGPDSEKTFDQAVAEAEAHRIVATVAASECDKGRPPSEILREIEKLTGVAPDRHPRRPNPAATAEDFRTAALQAIAYRFAMRRNFPQANDEQTVSSILAWNEVVLPDLRKLS